MEITMVKAVLEDFIPLFQQHYGEVNDDAYHRSKEVWEIVVNWRKEAYFFIKDECVIGGVLQPEDIVTGLFTVPPYEGYGELLELLLENLAPHPYTFYEIPEKYEAYYDERFELARREIMMFMKPCSQGVTLPSGYTSHPIKTEDVKEIGRVFYEAFSASPVYKSFDSLIGYTDAARRFFDYTKEHPQLYRASKLVRDEDGNLAGAILSMMDDRMPFAYNLAVSPSHQGKGLGKYLLGTLVEGVKEDHDQIRLFVHANNPARFMYESLGFQYGTEIATYIYNGISPVDDIEMSEVL